MLLQMWQEQAAITTTSPLQQDVSEVLKGMGIQHASEALTQDGLFSVDIMLQQAQTAVEVDGDSHFACNTQRPLGMTGYHAACVPHVWLLLSISIALLILPERLSCLLVQSFGCPPSSLLCVAALCIYKGPDPPPPSNDVHCLDAGRTVMRKKLLEARGWTVVSIPYFHWNSRSSLPAKQQYLRDKLPSSLL